MKAFDLLDAVHKGTLDGGHGVAAYWYGKTSAYSLFGTGPSFGMDANMLLGWMEYGGGRALYDELQHQVMKPWARYLGEVSLGEVSDISYGP